MSICPKCGRNFQRLLTMSRTDNKTMICDECGIREALNSLPDGILTPQECTQCIQLAVEATKDK